MQAARAATTRKRASIGDSFDRSVAGEANTSPVTGDIPKWSTKTAAISALAACEAQTRRLWCPRALCNQVTEAGPFHSLTQAEWLIERGAH